MDNIKKHEIIDAFTGLGLPQRRTKRPAASQETWTSMVVVMNQIAPWGWLSSGGRAVVL